MPQLQEKIVEVERKVAPFFFFELSSATKDCRGDQASDSGRDRRGGEVGST